MSKQEEMKGEKTNNIYILNVRKMSEETYKEICKGIIYTINKLSNIYLEIINISNKVILVQHRIKTWDNILLETSSYKELEEYINYPKKLSNRRGIEFTKKKNLIQLKDYLEQYFESE